MSILHIQLVIFSEYMIKEINKLTYLNITLIERIKPEYMKTIQQLQFTVECVL